MTTQSNAMSEANLPVLSCADSECEVVLVGPDGKPLTAIARIWLDPQTRAVTQINWRVQPEAV